jgi:hypothetical protein
MEAKNEMEARNEKEAKNVNQGWLPYIRRIDYHKWSTFKKLCLIRRDK